MVRTSAAGRTGSACTSTTRNSRSASSASSSCVAGKDAQLGHAALLTGLQGDPVARAIGLNSEGKLATALVDAGPAPFFISNTVSLSEDGGKSDPVQLTQDPLDSLQLYPLDTARALVVARAGAVVRLTRTDSRGASFTQVSKGNLAGPSRSYYDVASHTVYACYVEGGTGYVKLLKFSDDALTATDPVDVTGDSIAALDGTCAVAVAGGVTVVAFEAADHKSIVATRSTDSHAHAVTLGSGNAYEVNNLLDGLRLVDVTPHIAPTKFTTLDGTTTARGGYKTTQRIRKRVEDIFGCINTVGGIRKTRPRGLKNARLALAFATGKSVALGVGCKLKPRHLPPCRLRPRRRMPEFSPPGRRHALAGHPDESVRDAVRWRDVAT